MAFIYLKLVGKGYRERGHEWACILLLPRAWPQPVSFGILGSDVIPYSGGEQFKEKFLVTSNKEAYNKQIFLFIVVLVELISGLVIKEN